MPLPVLEALTVLWQHSGAKVSQAREEEDPVSGLAHMLDNLEGPKPVPVELSTAAPSKAARPKAIRVPRLGGEPKSGLLTSAYTIQKRRTAASSLLH